VTRGATCDGEDRLPGQSQSYQQLQTSPPLAAKVPKHQGYVQVGEERSLHEGLVELRRRCATIPLQWPPLPVTAASSLAVARVKQGAPKSLLVRNVALRGPWSFELGNRMTRFTLEHTPRKEGPLMSLSHCVTSNCARCHRAVPAGTVLQPSVVRSHKKCTRHLPRARPSVGCQ
jgi:hypothetical protein